MDVLLQGAVSALGFLDDDGKYCPEPDCYETLRDLIRYLRNDSNTFLARRIIGERNIVENDLVPLLTSNHDEERMFDIILRLMVNLLQPTLVVFMGKQPEDLEQTKLWYQLEENLRSAKLAFTDSEVFSILKGKLNKYFIETEWDDRTEEDRLVMERITVLIRYVLSISSSAHDQKRTALESNSHDRITMALLGSGIHKVFLHILSESQEKDFHLSVLEIIGYMIKNFTPDDIVSASQGRSDEEKKKAEQELRRVFETEQNKITDTKRKILSSRHSRFSGTYWIQGVNAINKENKFFTTKPIMDLNKISFLDDRKKKTRIAKNRRLCDNKEEFHVSSLNLRIAMKDFLEEILATGFNKLMRNTKTQALDSNCSMTHKNADIHYFLIMRFFLRFARLSKLSADSVSSCLGIDAFHNLQVKIDQYLENAALQRKEGKSHGVRAQFAVTAYKELILFTQYIVDHGSAEEKEEALATCKHILSVEEYRELAISILKKLQPAAVSKTFLQELILATHYYFRMLEKSVAAGNLISVLKKHKKKKASKPKKPKTTKQVPCKSSCDTWDDEHLDVIWANVCENLSDVVMGYEDASDDQIAIQSTLNSSDEEHQQFAMLRIQRALRERRISDAVGLYRLCRDIWYSDDIFGTQNMIPEEEFVELRNIFYANLTEIADNLVKAEIEASDRFAPSEIFDDEYDDDYDEMETSEYETTEVTFDFNGYIGRYAASDITKWYIFLLADFETNSVELNKALVKMLHRIAFDLKMHCRLFQLSLFRLFQRVNEKISGLDRAERKNSHYYELYTFGYHLLKRFFQRFEEIGAKMAPEVLFYKSSKEGYELEYGYGSFQHTEDEKKMVWTEEMEDDLRKLHNEWRDMDERPEGMDLLDYIEGNLDRARTRAQIQKKLKSLGLDTFGAKRTKGVDKTFPIISLKDLVEQFKLVDNYNELDLVDWLKSSLEMKGDGSYSRQKIIKHLAYAGIPYEKKKRAKNGSKKKEPNNFINDSDEEPIGETSFKEEESEEEVSDNDILPTNDNDDGLKNLSTLRTGSLKHRIIVESDDEEVSSENVISNSDNIEIGNTLDKPEMFDEDQEEHKKAKKRVRLISSDESDTEERPALLNEPPSGVQSVRKARKILIESDEDD